MIKINLIADRQAKDRLEIQQEVMLGILGLIALVVLCGIWWQAKSSQISETENQITFAKQERDRQKKIRDAVDEMDARRTRVNNILHAIDLLKEMKQGPAIYFDNLNVILPQEVWLTNVRDNRGMIAIKGYSFSNNSIAQLMKNMEKSEHFVNVDLEGIERAKLGDEILKEFTVNGMTVLGKKMEDERIRKEKEAEEAAKKKKNKKKGKR